MSRRSVVLRALVVVVLGASAVQANPPGVTLTLGGPTEYDAGVPVTFAGTFALAGAGLPLQTIELLVDGSPASTAQTSPSGSFSVPLTFAATPPTHTVQAFAHRGTPLESSSPQVTITLRPELVSLSVGPANPSIVVGQTLQFAAIGTFNTGAVADLTQEAVWSSSNAMVAGISNASGTRGLATGVSAGTTTISATHGSVTGSTGLTVRAPALVSISIAPTGATMTVGSSRQYTATGHYDDGSTLDVTAQASWSSANPMIVAVSNSAGSKGLATANGAGTTTITASLQMRNASTSVTAVHPAPVQLVINEVDYDQPGTDTTEFIEIYNPSSSPQSLDDLAIVLVNGADSTEYSRVVLFGTIPAGGYAVAASPGVTVPMGVPTFALAASNAIQNGSPDGVALFNTATNTLVDSLSYEGSITAAVISGAPGTYNLVEGTPTMVEDSNVVTASLGRSPNGSDTNDAATDWASLSPTPGMANA